MFDSSASIFININSFHWRILDLRIVLLAELSLQTPTKTKVLAVASRLDFWEIDVGKRRAGAKAEEQDRMLHGCVQKSNRSSVSWLPLQGVGRQEANSRLINIAE